MLFYYFSEVMRVFFNKITPWVLEASRGRFPHGCVLRKTGATSDARVAGFWKSCMRKQ